MFNFYGEFVESCYRCVSSLKTEFPEIERHFLLPYERWQTEKDFIKSIKDKGFEKCYYMERKNKFEPLAIILTNQNMIEKSDVVVCYYDKNHKSKSGTRKAVEYAIKKKKIIINLYY